MYADRSEVLSKYAGVLIFIKMNIKELQKTFIGRGEVKGFIFTQINKSEKAYLYKVDTGSSTHYEVFKHRINTQFNCVSYPSSRAFGSWAWSISDLEMAIDRFNELSE